MKYVIKIIAMVILLSGINIDTIEAKPFPGQIIKIKVGGKKKRMTRETSFSSLKHNILYDVNQDNPPRRKNVDRARRTKRPNSRIR